MIEFRRKPGRPRQLVRRTRITFSTDDLAALGPLVAAGQAVLQPEQRLPVLARLKAAMTRLGVLVPKGL